jgi:hypothetical protein
VLDLDRLERSLRQRVPDAYAGHASDLLSRMWEYF